MMLAHADPVLDETVAKNFSEWIEDYLREVSQADYLAVAESYREHRDAWSNVPELVTFMLNRT
jgi:hypothetical protein